MSIGIMILGESGTGKSTSLRNLNPVETLLIQAVRKPLPFKSTNWSRFDRETNPRGNIFVTDRADQICHLMLKTSRKIIVIDDWQYILANEYMRRSDEKGYEKFTDIGRRAWDILRTATELSDDRRVYILSHTATDDFGKTKIKTIGKLLDEKITPEGMVAIVLRTIVRDGSYLFSTQNNGADTTKSPIGMFNELLIDNDLAVVDAAICQYYGIGEVEHQEVA